MQLDGNLIFRCDDVGDKMYFIKMGYVQITNSDHTIVFTTLGPGAYFGDVAIVDHESPRRTASAYALADCVLYTLSVDDFKSIAGAFRLDNETARRPTFSKPAVLPTLPPAPLLYLPCTLPTSARDVSTYAVERPMLSSDRPDSSLPAVGRRWGSD